MYQTFVSNSCYPFSRKCFFANPEIYKNFFIPYYVSTYALLRLCSFCDFSSKARKFAPYIEGRIGGPRTDGR